MSKANYPDIKHIGSVTDVKSENLPQIDLLIGGSPCQGFSFAGKQLNFEDPRSKLFFEYVRLLKECKPKYFLLENVVMKKEFQDVISKETGVEPILINSALVSAQNRKRLYWTNIPGVTQPEDKGLLLKDILDESSEQKYYLSDKAKAYMSRHRNGKPRWEYHTNPLKGKAACLTANMYKGVPYGVIRELERRLTPSECEKLQSINPNYTKCVSDAQRYKMLGNGWTVDVIAHILKQIKTIHT